MGSKLDLELLDRCLTQIQRGDSTLEACLRAHPQLEPELRALLTAASRVHTQLMPGGPSDAYRAAAWARLERRVRTARAARPVARTRRGRASWRLSYSLVGLLVALGLALGSVGAAYASEDALPGDALYGVKRGLERAALALSTSDAGDSQLLLRFADRRLGEAEELIRRGRPGNASQALAAYEETVAELLGLEALDAGQLDRLALALSSHEVRLQEVLEQAPAQAVPGLTRALERSQHGIETVDQLRQAGPQGELPPGQLKKTPSVGTPTPRIPPGQLKKTLTPEA